MNDFKTWWEIPSIVHFCNVFSQFCKDICPLNINEFEQAVEENTFMLTDIAIRFIRICSKHNPKTNKWSMIKKNISINCFDCKIEYSQEFITCFNNLNCKQKVETLYTLCHIILDLKHIQDKIYHKPKLWNTLNIKPLGYDLNKSVYWYFGTTRLYREDFENMCDVSHNSSMMHDTIKCQNSSNISDSSNIDVNKNFLTDPYPSGIFGSGKWNTICDDNNSSWYSFADTIEYSKNINVKSLHKSICNIITNLPQVKRKMSHYKYIIPLRQKNFHTRLLRSKNLEEAKSNELLSNSDINEHEQYIQNYNVNQAENDSKCNKNVYDQDQITSYLTNVCKNKNKQVNTLNNGTALKLQSNNTNIIQTRIINTNNLEMSKMRQNCLERVVRVNIERFDNQENVLYNLPQKKWIPEQLKIGQYYHCSKI